VLGPNKFLKKRRLKQMNAMMVASGTKAVPPPVSSIQDIPIAKIRESKTNPRRFFDEAKLAELADNIRQHGVLQPVLVRLLPEGKQAFYEDKLTVAHAFEIARLQPNDQRRALQECFPQYRNAAAILKDKKAEATTVRELRAWIEREIHLDLTNAPFDPQDE